VTTGHRGEMLRLFRIWKWRLLLAALVLGSAPVGWLAWDRFREADATAQYSAQAALLVEIEGLLEDIHEGQAYPASLEELLLTYPDGGDASVLNLFGYETNGKSCTLRTKLRGEWITASYPQGDGP
jgi:hypothetical protein